MSLVGWGQCFVSFNSTSIYRRKCQTPQCLHLLELYSTTTNRTVLRPFFRDHPGEPVPEENFWTSWCKNRGRHTNHPAGRHSIRTNHCPPPPSHFFTGRMPFLPPNQQCQSTKLYCITETTIHSFHV